MFETTVEIPPDRRVVLTFPPETPVGLTKLSVESTPVVEEIVRRNPDTPEFRAFLDRSAGLPFDLRDWSRFVQEQAIENGEVPPQMKDLLTPTPENRRAFRVWREARHNRAFEE